MGRRTVGRQVLLAGVAVALLAGAGGVYWHMSQVDRPPADAYVGFYCRPCRHFFRLSERQVEDVWSRHEYHQGDGRQVRFKCPQCGQFTAERADEPPGGPNTPA
jgi:hypothetical protein